jgi:hypothetical protein
MSDGPSHMGPLRVHVTYDHGAWFARSMELDFAEQGTSLQDVKERFEKSLLETVHLSTQSGRSPRSLLRPAPVPAWLNLLEDAGAGRLLPERRLSDAVRLLPFDSILYLVRTASTVS